MGRIEGPYRSMTERARSAPTCATGRDANSAVSRDTPKRVDRVSHADFFALFVATSSIADGHFVDPMTLSGKLGGDFRLEAKSILLDFNFLEQIFPEDLVTGFHVGELLPGHPVGRTREQPVAKPVPPGGILIGILQKPRSVDHLGFAALNRCE